MTLKTEQRPISGVGVGLRSPHINEILTDLPNIPWFELLADNHMVEGGIIPLQLDAICEHYPVTFHSVGLSLGSVSPLDMDYLARLKKLMREHQVAWLSEHLCFTSFNSFHSHDLLPIPYSEESLKNMVGRISQVQDYLGEQILVENVSSYMQFKDSHISEVEFISAVAEQADCGLLIDVNNIYVNKVNLGVDAESYIDQLPHERIREIHLAGYEDKGDFLLDAHNSPVSDPVWALYQQLIQYVHEVPTLIEWDNDIPPLQILLEEAQRAEIVSQQVSEGAKICG